MEVIKIVFEEDHFYIPKRPLSVNKKRLTKQMSEKDMNREALWERRKRQVMMMREKNNYTNTNRSSSSSSLTSVEEDVSSECSTEVDVPCGREGSNGLTRVRSITKEDMDELEGSIDLGFGFDEEAGGHRLCNTLPALDLYFAINRSSKRLNHSPSPASTPTGTGTTSSSLSRSFGSYSPTSSSNYDNWKLLHPGDTPEHIKSKLKHWARAVACNVKQRQSENKPELEGLERRTCRYV